VHRLKVLSLEVKEGLLLMEQMLLNLQLLLKMVYLLLQSLGRGRVLSGHRRGSSISLSMLRAHSQVTTIKSSKRYDGELI